MSLDALIARIELWRPACRSNVVDRVAPKSDLRRRSQPSASTTGGHRSESRPQFESTCGLQSERAGPPRTNHVAPIREPGHHEPALLPPSDRGPAHHESSGGIDRWHPGQPSCQSSPTCLRGWRGRWGNEAVRPRTRRAVVDPFAAAPNIAFDLVSCTSSRR